MPFFRLLTKKEKKAIKSKKEKAKIKEKAKVEEEPKGAAQDLINEMIDKPMTTNLCDTAIAKENLSKIKTNPENYIEINIVEKAEVIDAFYIPSGSKDFSYGPPGKKITYKIIEDCLHLLPLKDGRFMLSLVYYEGKPDPISFKHKNKGITGKALSLLYDVKLYMQLLYAEEVKYNFWIVILLIAGLICYAIGCYFVFFHNGGMMTSVPQAPAQSGNWTFIPSALIKGVL